MAPVAVPDRNKFAVMFQSILPPDVPREPALIVRRHFDNTLCGCVSRSFNRMIASSLSCGMRLFASGMKRSRSPLRSVIDQNPLQPSARLHLKFRFGFCEKKTVSLGSSSRHLDASSGATLLRPVRSAT
jgi:hypothetical protein